MTFRPFYLFYLLTILLIVWGFVTTGLWTFFISTSVASLVTGLTYNLLYKTGRQVSQTLIIIHFGLVFVGLPLTLNLYRAFAILAEAHAPDTTAIGGGISFFGPLFLIGSLVIFIVAISTSKKTTV